MTFQCRAHELRRTAASYMREAGVDRFHIGYVLNYRSVTHSTVTAIYDRTGHIRCGACRRAQCVETEQLMFESGFFWGGGPRNAA